MEENKNTNTQNTASSGNSTSTQPAKESENNAEKTENQAAAVGNDIAAKVGDVLRGDTSSVKNLYDKAKESGGQVAGQVLDQAKEKASSALDEQKTNLAAGLGSVADGLRQVGGSLREGDEQNSIVELSAKYGDSLAQQVEKVSNYLDRKDVKEMVKDIEVFARRNPAIFIGAAFALGFLAIRFLKSSNPNQSLTQYSNKDEKTDDNTKTSSSVDTELPAY